MTLRCAAVAALHGQRCNANPDVSMCRVLCMLWGCLATMARPQATGFADSVEGFAMTAQSLVTLSTGEVVFGHRGCGAWPVLGVLCPRRQVLLRLMARTRDALLGAHTPRSLAAGPGRSHQAGNELQTTCHGTSHLCCSCVDAASATARQPGTCPCAARRQWAAPHSPPHTCSPAGRISTPLQKSITCHVAFHVYAGGESCGEVSGGMAVQIELYSDLGLHFKVIDMPSGDLGAPAFRKVDIEAWMPGLGRYGEISSASNCTDYQARRLNTRYRVSAKGADDGAAREGKRKGKKGKGSPTAFCYTLNATACAVPRLIVSIIENYQREDGSVEVPEALRPYLGGMEVISAPQSP